VWSEDYAARMTVELHHYGLDARADVELWWPAPGHEVDLLAFFQGLADDWRGWSDLRQWRSKDAAMVIDASHDGSGSVCLTVTLRDDTPASCAWSASITVNVEAGEQLAQLVTAVRELLGR
jgi:hypothetical protein